MTAPQNTLVSDKGLLREGDLVLLIDRKARRRMIRLKADAVIHSHTGSIPHAQLIGQPEGSRHRTSHGEDILVVRPTLPDYALKMPREATIIYPKDTGAILVFGDIYPGATVIEAGAGSGALTIALLRAVGEKGRVISYEVRELAAARAARNVADFAPELEGRWTLRIGDITEAVLEEQADRMVLDLPEPWAVLPMATQVLRDGGILVSYVPTALQVFQTVQALRESQVFGMVESMEVIMRPWDVSPISIRPAHRMVAHTGFLTIARKLQPGADFTPVRHRFDV